MAYGTVSFHWFPLDTSCSPGLFGPMFIIIVIRIVIGDGRGYCNSRKIDFHPICLSVPNTVIKGKG